MASFDTTPHHGLHINLLDIVAAPFRAVWWFFSSIADSNDRMKKFEWLSRLSDAELAERGLKREDLAHHVFIG